MKLKKELTALPLFSPSVVLLTMFVFIPFFFLLYMVFTGVSIVGEPAFVGLDNFVVMVKDPLFWSSFQITLVYTACVTIGNVTIPLLTALALNSIKFTKIKNFMRSCYLMPVAISVIIAAIVWSWMYTPQIGAINVVLKSLGFQEINPLGNPSTALYTIALVDIWKNIGFYTIMYIVYLDAIPEVFIEAAIVDGAKQRHIIWHIILPLLVPGILVVMVFSLAGSIAQMALSYQMTFGGPGFRTLTLMFYIYIKAFRSFNISYAAVMSLILFAVGAAIAYLQFKISKSEVLY